MKKIMFITMAFAAMNFASCGNKNAANVTDADSTAQEEVVSADELVSSLDEAVAAGATEGTETALANFNESIQKLIDTGKTEDAQAYIEKLKTYVAEHKNALAAVVPSLVEKIDALPTDAKEAVESLGESVKSNVAEKANELVEGVEDKAQEQVDAAKAKAQEQVDAAKAKADEQVKAAQEKAKEKANEAINNAAKDLKKGLGL